MNDGPDQQGPKGRDSEELGSEELALRTLLRQAVEEIEPREGTLEHLRRAVPARRARRRQALVGLAAAALFVGTAVPALVHVSNSTGSDANPSAAGHASQAQGGAGGQPKVEDDKVSSGGGDSGASQPSGGTGDTEQDVKETGGASDGTTGGPVATPSAESTTPACTPEQLGGASGTVGSPDSAGAVYGTFRVVNVSAAICTVTSAGTVAVAAQGAADQAKIGVASHVEGDEAAGLPDPSLQVAELVLQPGAAYEVKFAWVPSETCPTDGGPPNDPEPSPTPTPTATTPTSETGGGTTSEGTTGATPQLVREEDGLADGSVVVSHTAEGGMPTTTATVSNACAGTIYWTGLLASA
ncbi:hypothetical protein [Streptomyces sp. NPDC002845]